MMASVAAGEAGKDADDELRWKCVQVLDVHGARWHGKDRARACWAHGNTRSTAEATGERDKGHGHGHELIGSE